MNRKECRVETMRGTGPGGQHRNKTNSAVRITHLPTGVTAYADERSQRHSKKRAWADLESKLHAMAEAVRADKKKAHRDAAIRNRNTIRTYHYGRNEVKDHRTGKTAPLAAILEKADWSCCDDMYTDLCAAAE